MSFRAEPSGVVAESKGGWIPRLRFASRGMTRITVSARKAPMLIIGAMMHKLIHAAFGVLKSGLPFNPTLHGA